MNYRTSSYSNNQLYQAYEGFSKDTALQSNTDAVNELVHRPILQCPMCPIKVFDDYNLKAHMSQMHGDQMPFTCNICGKGYTSTNSLNRHLVTHKGKFSCPVCDAKFTQKSSVKPHMKTAHQSTECPSCRMVFKLGDSFNRHVINCNEKR